LEPAAKTSSLSSKFLSIKVPKFALALYILTQGH
jgi:hypothetical protein